MDLKDMEMPAKKAEGAEEEMFDFGFEDAASEEAPASDLASISDEELLEEMKRRGFEVEDEMEEDLDSGEEAPLPEEEPAL
jgi:hypothetical protein